MKELTKKRTLSLPELAGAVVVVLLCLPSLATAQVGPDETDPVKIMQAVQDRDDGDRSTSRMRMVVRDNAGRQRVRMVQSRRMDFTEGSKTLIIFESPADVRNTGLLSIDYDGDKDDDQWLYLPSLRKPTRIASGDKSGSFMGTDLSYSDMTQRDVGSYTYTIVEQSVVVQGEECWKIQALPANDDIKSETGYFKSFIWVSKAKLLVTQIKAHMTSGQRVKFIRFADIRQIQGVWMVHKILAMTKRGGETESKTMITFSDVRFNVAGVTESDFTQRRLEQGL